MNNIFSNNIFCDNIYQIIKLIFVTLSVIYFIVQLCFIPAWRKSVAKKTGALILKTITPKNSKGIIVLILCPLLVFFAVITRSTFFICCLMCLVSALAYFIAVREIVFAKLNGIYQNGLIGNGRFIPFDSIQTFPDTSWKEPEKEETISLAIQLKPRKNEQPSITFIDYASITEYSNVVSAIKQLKQNK